MVAGVIVISAKENEADNEGLSFIFNLESQLNLVISDLKPARLMMW